MELWKPIKDLEDFYEVSSFGRVRSKPRVTIRKNGVKYNVKGRVLKANTTSTSPYLYVCLATNSGTGSGYNPEVKNFCVHRLVAEHFVSGDGEVVNHKDHNHHNNRADNLEWTTQSENRKHAYLRPFYRSRTIMVKTMRNNGFVLREIAESCGMGISNVKRILDGELNYVG